MNNINFKTPSIDEDTCSWNSTNDELCIHVKYKDDDNEELKIVLIFFKGIVSDYFYNLDNTDEGLFSTIKDTAKKNVIEKLKTEENGKLLIILIEKAIEDQEVQKGLQSNNRIGLFSVPEWLLKDYR